MTIDSYRTPLLTARETARYLKMPESTLNSWLAPTSDEPLVHAVPPERRGWPRVPFVGIVEAHVLRALRVVGTPMDEIRKAAAIAPSSTTPTPWPNVVSPPTESPSSSGWPTNP